MSIRKVDKDPVGMDALSARHGTYTQKLLLNYCLSSPMTANEAFIEIAKEMDPFNVRLSRYVASRFDIEDDEEVVKTQLRKAGKEKGFEPDSWRISLNQWISHERQEVYLSPQSIFKLCLSMELDIEESVHFIYDCLYKNWFNYRVIDEAIYFFFLGKQDLFGNETYANARQTLKRLLSDISTQGTANKGLPEGYDNAGYTRVLGDEIRLTFDEEHSHKQEAIDAIERCMRSNAWLFTGVQISGIRTYDTYFNTGGVNFKSLRTLYHDATGATLPETSYLDMAYMKDDIRSKRLLWGIDNRRDWLEINDQDCDILNEKEIRIEQHSVGKMRTAGVLRGNIIALLFFHFCYENADDLKNDARNQLFNRFYKTTNMILIDECGMMPLHPRKPFDKLFLTSLANSGHESPIDMLNNTLVKFYNQGM